MSQITIGGTTLNFKDSAFTGDQWEQVASWVLNGGAEGIDANAQIATEKAAAASASAATSRNSATSAGESATAAANSAASASSSATAAANSAVSAAESIKHAPRINSYGKWELWDATTNVYVATEYTAIGKDGTKWWTYAYPIGITAALEKIMSKSNLPDADIGDYVLHTMSDAGIVFEITGETADGSSWVVKEKCTLRGKDGTTPHIGANGNWYIGSTDTGKPSRGATGEKGDPGAAGAKGADGSSIQSIERTSGTGAPGTTDTYTVTLTNGDTTTFQVYNGKDGSGSGDMTKAVYDPKGKAQDIFSYADTKYSKPSGGIPKKDLASDVQTSLGKADSALQRAPVTSVNSKTGAVNLAKGDVGLGNVDNVKQYSASNPPPYPVTSVNGKTGAVTVSIPTVPSTTSLIKGNGSGGLVAATRGSDYIASGNIVKQTLVATETTPTENYAINWVYG